MSESQMTPTYWLAQFYDSITGPLGAEEHHRSLRGDAVRVIRADNGKFDVALILERGVGEDDARRATETAKAGLRKILPTLNSALD